MRRNDEPNSLTEADERVTSPPSTRRNLDYQCPSGEGPRYSESPELTGLDLTRDAHAPGHRVAGRQRRFIARATSEGVTEPRTIPGSRGRAAGSVTRTRDHRDPTEDGPSHCTTGRAPGNANARHPATPPGSPRLGQPKAWNHLPEGVSPTLNVGQGGGTPCRKSSRSGDSSCAWSESPARFVDPQTPRRREIRPLRQKHEGSRLQNP